MQVWFVDRIDSAGDGYTYAPCINQRVAEELIVRLLSEDERFAKQYDIDPPGYSYQTYPVGVIENAEDLP